MRYVSLLVAGLVLAPAAVHADDITDQLDQAKQSYQQGDLSGAVEDLQFTLQAIRAKLSQAYEATFPAAPAGWTAEAAKSKSGGGAAILGGGAVLTRTYRAQSGAGSIQAQIMTGGSFMQGLAQMFMNPAVLAAQPNAKRLRIGRDNAIVTYNPDDKSGQLMVNLAGKVSIVLQGSGLAGEQPMIDLIHAWDIKKVKSIAGL